MDLGPVARLAALVGADGHGLDDGHARWRVYEQAAESPGTRALLHRCVAAEDDPVLASAVVVHVLGRVPRSERGAWVDALPEEAAEFPRKRAAELGTLADAVAGDLPADQVSANLPDWSDWLQLRAAEQVRDPRILEHLEIDGRTKRIRRIARESHAALESGRS